jgi:hypothetical protein
MAIVPDYQVSNTWGLGVLQGAKGEETAHFAKRTTRLGRLLRDEANSETQR